VVGDRGRGKRPRLVGRRSGGRRPAGTRPDRRGPQPRGIGVETEDDLTATLLYERREPVGEGIPGACARVSRWAQPFTADLSADPALNRGTLLAAISMRSPVCGLTP
jgi:hypothetical protein